LRRTLKEVYYLKGKDGSTWLNIFETQLVSEAKNLFPEGQISMDDDLKAVEGVIGMLRFVFSGVRTQIANESKDK
jgi:hypothetical protein